jgi:hypothetical protein
VRLVVVVVVAFEYDPRGKGRTAAAGSLCGF